VAFPEEYLYSSAKNYLNEKGLLNIVKVDTSFSEFQK
jgi:hypothetical protein